MKKLIIATTLLAFASASVFAQAAKMATAPQASTTTQASTPQERVTKIAEHQAKTYEQQYKLNSTQYTGVYNACVEFNTKMESQRSSGKQIKREDVEAALAERNAKFKAVMSPEQYKAYDATQAHSMPQPVPATKKM